MRVALGTLSQTGRWRLALAAMAPLPLLSLGYFGADPAISNFAMFKAHYAGRSSVHMRVASGPGAQPYALSEQTAELFVSGVKGPRADRYLEIKTTQYVERQPRVVLASLTGGVDVTGAIPRAGDEREAVNRSAKSELLMTSATFGHAGTAVFLNVLNNAVDKSDAELEQKEEASALRLPRGLAAQGETEAEYQERQRRCLATAIYFEARGEPVQGQLAVAQVVMNRVRSPDFPDTICGVVFQGQWERKGCQFSFACDGRPDVPKDQSKWEEAMELSRKVTEGKAWLDDIGHATYYHATYVKPNWVRDMNRIEKIGQHIFYRFRREKPYVVEDGGSAPSGSPARGLAFSGSG